MASSKSHQHMSVFMVFCMGSRLTAAVLFYCSDFIFIYVIWYIPRGPLSLEKDLQLFFFK